MKKTKIAALIIISFALTVLLMSHAEARVYLDITSADFRKISVAVPYFENRAAPGQIDNTGMKMADILSRALTFHGFISIIPPSTYGGKQNCDWGALGAEFTVLGQYYSTGSGIALEMRLMDIHEGTMITGQKYTGTISDQRLMLYRSCDEIILKLTGEAGVCLSKIAFVSDATGYQEVFISDILGDEIRQITQHNSITVSPRFSPDCSKLAYTSYHRGNPNLYITNLSQSQTTKAFSWRKGLNLAPAWSPDGQSIVLTLSIEDTPDLYLLDTNGKILDRLTSGSGINVSASWSPDGRQLAFVSDRSGTPQIYIMDVKTKAVRRITFHGEENTTPNWSPQGDWIAYTGRYEGHLQIFIIKPDEGRPVQLTQAGGEHESPSWSPDGRQIVFSRKKNGKKDLCAIFKNGTGYRPLLQLKGNQQYPQWSPRLKDVD